MQPALFGQTNRVDAGVTARLQTDQAILLSVSVLKGALLELDFCSRYVGSTSTYPISSTPCANVI